MKHRIAAALLALVATAPFFAPHSAAAQTARPALLTVTGEGSITQAPDRATVSFAIETTDEQAANATSHNAAISNALNARLATLGIAAAAIKTTGYGLNYIPRPSRPDPNNPVRYGYTVTRSIDVSLDRIDGVGAVVDAGVAAGVTNVNGVAFGLRDDRAALRSAQAAALADAQQQARALAAAAGVRIVRIVAINPGGGIVPRGPVLQARALVAAVPTTIEPSDLTVNAQVTVAYEIAPLH